jgi:hypothetical protein
MCFKILKILIIAGLIILNFSSCCQNSKMIREFITLRANHPNSITIKTENLTQQVMNEIILTYPKYALRAITKIESTETRYFLEENGFIPMRTTWTGEIDLEKVDIKDLEKALKFVKAKNWNVGVVPDYLIHQWLKRHEISYQISHSINPFVFQSESEINKIFKGDDFEANYSYAVYRDTIVAAHSSLRNTKSGWEIGWFGSSDNIDGISAETLNQALKAIEISAAIRMGVKKIYVEYDSTDGQAMSIMGKIPIEKPEIWITYQTKIANKVIE